MFNWQILAAQINQIINRGGVITSIEPDASVKYRLDESNHSGDVYASKFMISICQKKMNGIYFYTHRKAQ
jgi:hypothetical protein